MPRGPVDATGGSGWEDGAVTPPTEHTHDAHGPTADASVRPGRTTDAPAVGMVQAASWQESYADVVPAEVLAAFEPAAFASGWRRSMQNPPEGAYDLLVACAGPQVVGFASVGPTQDPDADLETGELLVLCVHPEARRSGHGSRLLNAAMASLADAGATTVHAWLLATDEGARAFLQESGFGPDGAYRDRVVGPSTETAREVRVVAALGDQTTA